MSQQNSVESHDRQLKALELRKAGISYQAIADTLGYNSPQAAWKAVNAALKKTLQEPSDEVRKLEMERLDAMLSAIWASVKQGQYKANEVALRLMERRAKLLGLDAPVKTDLTSNGQTIHVTLKGDE